MEIKTVYAVYFSATGNTRKVVTTLANALAESFEVPLELVDFTRPYAREESYSFTDKDLVVFGTPTYAGKVPNKLLDFVKTGFAGNGALAVVSELMSTCGPDSYEGRVAAVMMGSTETTFYTIAVYFGSAGIRKTRHAIPAALVADLTGFLASALAVRIFFGT